MANPGIVALAKARRDRPKKRDYHFRLTEKERELVAKAAELEGFSTAPAFASHHVVLAARETLLRHHMAAPEIPIADIEALEPESASHRPQEYTS